MNYIENTYICLAAPLLLAILCLRADARRSLSFVLAGMTACLLSAYVSAFIADTSGTDLTSASYEIAPVVERIYKSWNNFCRLEICLTSMSNKFFIFFSYNSFSPIPIIIVNYFFYRCWRSIGHSIHKIIWR